MLVPWFKLKDKFVFLEPQIVSKWSLMNNIKSSAILFKEIHKVVHIQPMARHPVSLI